MSKKSPETTGWRRSTVVAVGCLVVSGCLPLRKPEEPSGPHFSALTYNVNWGAPGPDLAAKAIEQADADVVGLQETTPAWERLLRPRLGAAYPHMRFRHDAGAGGMAVLSRWPIQDVAFVRSKAGWFPGWIVRVETPVGPVQFLNVHLRPPVSERGSVGPGPYVSTKAVRKREIRELHARLESELPTIVLGDFNEDDSGSAVAWLKAQGMKDALREFDRRTNTWQWRTRYVTLRDRLDHIFYSSHLRCLSARVIKEGASDHFPLMALFESAPREQDDPTKKVEILTTP
jgi:endonuclease/exonuclease/phosphatase family metal-dependent hydrolase